jgi:hypothetical protein
MLHPVTSGEFAGKALRLPDNFYWYAGIDIDGQRILVPTTRMKG